MSGKQQFSLFLCELVLGCHLGVLSFQKWICPDNLYRVLFISDLVLKDTLQPGLLLALVLK